jgi:hypothetical protein
MNNLKPGQTYEIKKRSLHWKESKTIHTCNYLSFKTDKQIQERRKNKVTLKVKRVLHFQKRVND